MNYKFIRVLCFVSGFCSLIFISSSCVSPYFETRQSPQREGENLPGKSDTKKEFVRATFDESTSTGEFAAKVYQKLGEEDFAWLEETASKARKNKERLKGGYWAIRTFYSGIQPGYNSEAEYEKLIEKLNRWKTAYPESPTPYIALFEAWAAYAVDARGTGYVDTVSRENWQLYKERMKNAQSSLLEAKSLREKCPYWYVGMLEIAKNESWDFEDFEVLFQEAIAFEPDFYYFYQAKGMYLLPRYSGEPGQWEKFIEEVGRQKSARLYYEVLSHFILKVGDMPYDTGKYSRERAEQGFFELRKEFGADKTRLNEYAKFTMMAGGIETAAEIFDEIGNNWDSKVWRNKQEFEQSRQGANNVRNAKENRNYRTEK